jgi:superfamily I DNA/RNA helicase
MAYFFKLPPITDLTPEQQSALNDPNPIAISGGPGTGKSVVSLWRHIRNYAISNSKSLLLTYTKTLEAYLSASAKSEAENTTNSNEKQRIIESSKNVDRTYWWLTHKKMQYEEIIVDEAQDVKLKNYDELKKYSNSLSYGADPGQSIYLTEKELVELNVGLKSLFPNREYMLSENFRNTRQIVQFIKSVFPNKLISPSKEVGVKPQLILSNGNIENQKKAIVELINQLKSDRHNIVVLLPLKEHVRAYYNFISSQKIICSQYYEGLPFNGIENVHITTFKSCKGTEFHTVIIPGFDKMEEIIKEKDVVEKEDYYVAMTRARNNLYLFASNQPSFLSKVSLNLCEISSI